jgi:hypothetical protein
MTPRREGAPRLGENPGLPHMKAAVAAGQAAGVRSVVLGCWQEAQQEVQRAVRPGLAKGTRVVGQGAGTAPAPGPREQPPAGRSMRVSRLGGTCRAAWRGSARCSAVQCSAVQCSAVQCSAVQCSAVQWEWDPVGAQPLQGPQCMRAWRGGGPRRRRGGRSEKPRAQKEGGLRLRRLSGRQSSRREGGHARGPPRGAGHGGRPPRAGPRQRQ